MALSWICVCQRTGEKAAIIIHYTLHFGLRTIMHGYRLKVSCNLAIIIMHADMI